MSDDPRGERRSASRTELSVANPAAAPRQRDAHHIDMRQAATVAAPFPTGHRILGFAVAGSATRDAHVHGDPGPKGTL